MAIGDEEIVFGGYRIYDDRTNDVVTTRGYSSKKLSMRLLEGCTGSCGVTTESMAMGMYSLYFSVIGLVGLISFI